jgi:hypothetical protein
MYDTSPVVVFLPPEDCATTIAALWATASTRPEQDRAELLAVAAVIHVELCRRLEVDPLQVPDLLVGLPSRLHAAYGTQLAKHARLRPPL